MPPGDLNEVLMQVRGVGRRCAVVWYYVVLCPENNSWVVSSVVDAPQHVSLEVFVLKDARLNGVCAK